MDLNKLEEKQISLTEWLEKIGFRKTEEFRKEDNKKRKTLAILNRIIGLPFDKPIEFSATEINNNSSAFQNFFQTHQNELCAYRLIPNEENLPKLRMRGYTVSETLDWFLRQNIDPNKYHVDIIPHSENYDWSTIFVVNKNGIFGEIIQGNPFMLTQGFYAKNKPITFAFDFENWQMDTANSQAEEHLKMLVRKIKVENLNQQKEIQEKLGGIFFQNYLAGYFETTSSPQFGLWFIDWNKILGEMYGDYQIIPTEKPNNDTLQGTVAYPGNISGKVKIINNSDTKTINPNEILTCNMTTPEHIPLMKICSGIITEQGGILSHAAIVARELKKPCIVGVEKVLEKLKDGDLLEIKDGIIKKIK